MDKLILAHEYALKIIETHKDMFPAAKCVSNYAFDYAEAMLTENEKRRDKTRPAALEEFQVDWSQAPDWANWWAVDSNGICYWYMIEPRLTEIFPNEWIGCGYPTDTQAPSFNYQGDWKDSLRKRK